MGDTAVTIQSLLEAVSTTFTTALSWVGDVLGTIAAEPILLLMCVAIPLVGLGIGFARRLFSVT